MHELVYTSAPKGLKPGSQGFCTVACSAGMPPNLMLRLEALSGYRHLFSPGQSRQVANPVVRSHLVLRVGGTDWHVLSRIADAGIDYTQRSNKIAHHIVLDASELSAAGPAALLACEGRFFRKWDGEPKLIMKPAAFPQIQSPPKICRHWENLTGDAGWGGILAETARENRPVNLVVTPETDAIALFGESLALLPPELRWQTTMTTYYTRFPSGVGCRWRCIIAGSPEMSQVELANDATVIDLTQPLKTPVPGPLVKAARSGKAPTAFLNLGNIAGLSDTLDAERRQSESLPERRPDNVKTLDVTNSQTEDAAVETVPVEKTRKSKAKKKRQKQDRFYEHRDHWLQETRQQEKWGLLMLLGIGLLFFGVPALLLGVLFFAKGCNDPAAQSALRRPVQNSSQDVRPANRPTKNAPLTPTDAANTAPRVGANATQGKTSPAAPDAMSEHAVNELQTSDAANTDNINADDAPPLLYGEKLIISIWRNGGGSGIEAKTVELFAADGFADELPATLFDLPDAGDDTLLMTLAAPERQAGALIFEIAESPGNVGGPEPSKRIELYARIDALRDAPLCVAAFEVTPTNTGFALGRVEYRLFDELVKSINEINKMQLGNRAPNRSPFAEISLPESSDIDDAKKSAWVDELTGDETWLANVAAFRSEDAAVQRRIDIINALLHCHAENFAVSPKNRDPTQATFDYDVYQSETVPGNGTRITHVVTSQSKQE